jgi:hypothetical protein
MLQQDSSELEAAHGIVASAALRVASRRSRCRVAAGVRVEDRDRKTSEQVSGPGARNPGVMIVWPRGER